MKTTRIVSSAPAAAVAMGVMVPELIASSAAANPTGCAIVGGARSLTYSELESRANRTAHRLRSLGLTRNEIVAVCLERSPELIISELAIWRSGAAYVPLDPSYPDERLGFMLRDCGARVLIADDAIAGRLKPRAAVVHPDDGASSDFACMPSEPRTGGDDLAYVIYTSGSTGQPKGVEITHAGLVNLVLWHLDQFHVTEADRASHLAGVGFDAAAWEVWPYLAAGASVHIPDDDVRVDPCALRNWLVKQRVSISFAPTALAERLIRLPWPARTELRLLLTGADMLHMYPPASLPFKLINNYGPTECTVVATSAEIPPADHPGTPPPIGRPIRGTEVHIVDEQMRAVPAGSPGELYIGGPGLARGYLNRPDLTAQSFVEHPFVSGARLYRTGDRGRLLPTGEIAFLGRVDTQIKIAGHRIEPAEITVALRRHPAVVEAAVSTRANGAGEPELVAYLVRIPGSRVTATDFGRHLKTFLPAFMVPSWFVDVPALPLTANGKLDVTALPCLADAQVVPEASPPARRSQVETRLQRIVARLLKVRSVAYDDNIFMIGGHSLLAAQLIVKIRESFGVELALRTVFEAATLTQLAAEIERCHAVGRAQTAG